MVECSVGVSVVWEWGCVRVVGVSDVGECNIGVYIRMMELFYVSVGHAGVVLRTN